LAAIVRAMALPCLIAPGCVGDDLDHARFEGVVRDANGGAIARARMVLRQSALGVERATRSEDDGRYRFAAVPPGIYELRAEAEGFQSARYDQIQATAGQSLQKDFKLSPAAIEAQMTIGAESEPLVDTARTVVGGSLGRAQMDALPAETRNPLDLIYTLPQTSPPALSDRDLAEGDRQSSYRRPPEEAGVFSLAGGTPFSNNLTIEGLDNNDDRAARERFLPSMHAVEEVQVVTNQFSAEYGRASGGRVNLRLRSGANQVHGQAFHYFRDEAFNANPFMRNADPARAKRLPYQNHNPGLGLGAPLRKDKVFLFAAYELDYIHDRAEIAALVPVAGNREFVLPAPNGANLGFETKDKSGRTVVVNDGAAVGLYDRKVTTPRVAHTLQSRADFKLGERHDSFALLTLAGQRDERGFPGGRRTLDTLRRAGRDSRSLAFADNFILSKRMVSIARFQFSRLTPADAPPGASPVVIIDFDDPRDVIGDPDANPQTRRGRLTAGASTSGGVDRREDRYQFQETLSYVRGSHTLRAGADVQAIRSRFVDLNDSTGTYTFASPGAFLANKPSRYEHRFFTDSELRNTYTGLFFQDDWKPRRHLTLAFGLRWDHETILADRNNLGPRGSIAWAPRASSKTAVRAGYGLFYNRALLRTLDDYLLTSKAVTVDTNDDGGEGLLAQLAFPRVLAAGDPRVTTFGVREAGFRRRLAADFRIPESYQASLGFERELRRNLKIEVNYVFNRGLHLWREVNANAPRLPAGFSDFAEYLTSREFDNQRDPATGRRPITATGNADVVRFNRSAQPTQTLREGDRTIVVFGLNNPSTSNQTSGLNAALEALRPFRPDPALTQIEELQARGNSAYHGLSVELTRRMSKRGFLRGSYTFSRLMDDGVVNTSSPLVAGDFRRERSRSLMDARHRVALSGVYDSPFWRVKLAGTFAFSSARPFNISANGNDRNLDDVDNDRPNFAGDLRAINWRRPGASLQARLAEGFSLPTIGTVGDLPRNAGRGPAGYTLNLRLSRTFTLAERRTLEFQIEAFNPLNSAVFSFGAEFVNFTPAGLGAFLTPQRTVKPRTMRVGMRFGF
jgi:hypothetical protein